MCNKHTDKQFQFKLKYNQIMTHDKKVIKKRKNINL